MRKPVVVPDGAPLDAETSDKRVSARVDELRAFVMPANWTDASANVGDVDPFSVVKSLLYCVPLAFHEFAVDTLNLHRLD